MTGVGPEDHPVIFSVVPGAPEGNSMIFAKRQISALLAAGVPGHVFYISSRTRPDSLWNEFWALRREIKRIKPDVVHAHYGTVTGLITALASSVPLVINYRGSDLLAPDGDWRSRIGLLMSQLAALKARRIVCVGEHLVQALWWRKDRASVIPSGVDMDHFRPGDRTAARQKLGWDLKVPTVVFNAGKNFLIKRLDLATAAVQVARQEMGNIHFEVFDGNQNSDYILDVFQAADCLLLTSVSEGSPNVVKEALACDLPVVSVDVGDVAIRLDGVEPSMIVPDTPELLAKALTSVLSLGGRRCNGRQAIRSLGMDRTVISLLSVYREAMGS